MNESSKAVLPLLRLCALGLLISSPAFSSSAFAAPWSFVVAGDGRTDFRQKSPDSNGINTEVFTNLLHSIAREKPRFMLFTGDLVSGTNANVHTPIDAQFRAWKALVKVAAPGLTVLPVRGNHETYGDPDGKLWLATFKSDLDANGVLYFPGEEGFSYSYSAPDHPEVVVVGLDQFIREHRVNLGELEKALRTANANKASHVFVFAHEMAFTCTSHGDSDNMAAFPNDRDKFVEMLERYRCEYFFAGHDHAYDWMLIRHWSWPTNYVLNQIVAGTAGAPFYDDKTYFGDHHGYDLTRWDHQRTNGYLRVVVDDGSISNKVTVTFETTR